MFYKINSINTTCRFFLMKTTKRIKQNKYIHTPTFKNLSLVNSATCFSAACFSTYLKYLPNHTQKEIIKYSKYLTSIWGKRNTQIGGHILPFLFNNNSRWQSGFTVIFNSISQPQFTVWRVYINKEQKLQKQKMLFIKSNSGKL